MAQERSSPRWRRVPQAVRLGVVSTISSVRTRLSRLLDWLRKGYPERAPGTDRVPLLALLRTTPLTDDEVTEVVGNLTANGSPALADGGITEDEIEASICEVTGRDAGPENIRRVAAELAAAGWPLAE